MSDSESSKTSRLCDLARDLPPPHDGWPALEARLRQSGRSQPDLGAEQRAERRTIRHWRPRMMRHAALAAVIAAVVVGISIDRWILSPGRPAPQVASAPGVGTASGGLTVAYVTDPRYVRAREAMLRSLNARLARLPPPTRKKVLESLATIHRSMQEIQQALGREPGNALLQELLIDTYQNEMQVLSTVQEASGGGGET